jgi:hypothetical protein
MDIHKPKPIHNWRELLKEIGIIVIGVSIALGAEQAVQTMHEHHRASQARDSIRGEIANTLGQMEVRNVTEACVTRRMDEVEALIAASAAAKLPQVELWLGRPLFLISADNQYKSVTQSGDLRLLGVQEQAVYAFLYGDFEFYRLGEAEEQKAWAALRTLEKHPAASAVLDWQLRSALQDARTARWKVEAGRGRAMAAAAAIGIKPAVLEKYNPGSICLPLHTPRTEAVKLVVQGRPGKLVYDEP